MCRTSCALRALHAAKLRGCAHRFDLPTRATAVPGAPTAGVEEQEEQGGVEEREEQGVTRRTSIVTFRVVAQLVGGHAEEVGQEAGVETVEVEGKPNGRSPCREGGVGGCMWRMQAPPICQPWG